MTTHTHIIKNTLIVITALLVTGCGTTLPHKHMDMRDENNTSMIYGLLDPSELEMELESVLLIKKAANEDEKDQEIYLRVAGDVFYMENLQPGDYEITAFTAKSGAWSSDGSIRKAIQFDARNKHQRLRFSLIHPGVYFIGDMILSKGGGTLGAFHLAESNDIYEKRRALTTVLFYSSDPEWIRLAKESPIDHPPAMELESSNRPVVKAKH